MRFLKEEHIVRARYLTGFLAPTLLLFGLAVLAAPSAYAQGTPDEETPANEGVCDELAADGITKGLYGMCVAFCEAQDCEPDLALSDLFEKCRPSNEKLLQTYDKRKQPGDPEMPCVKDPCPCWDFDDLINLVVVSPVEAQSCFDGNRDFWRQANAISAPITQVVQMQAWSPGFSPFFESLCYLQERDPSFGQRIVNIGPLSQEQFDACQADVIAIAQERGLDCWD